MLGLGALASVLPFKLKGKGQVHKFNPETLKRFAMHPNKHNFEDGLVAKVIRLRTDQYDNWMYLFAVGLKTFELQHSYMKCKTLKDV